jgi:tetratricopeptide (TPR) repeat protein
MTLLAVALLLAGALQTSAPDRTRAEDLARAGRTLEAMDIFRQIVATNPGDVEAQSWVARLALRLGRTADAETAFRAVLKRHPSDIDARIGLGMTLTRAGAAAEALDVLKAVEPAAGQNADLFSALARAYRRSGDDRQALAYFERARALAPNDSDVVLGYEAVARSYGHWIAAEGFGQGGAPGADVGSGSLAVSIRLAPRLHIEGSGRLQRGSDYADATVGAGLAWRASRDTTVSFHAAGGPDNIALATRDVSGDVVQYAGALEIGASVRWLSFTPVDVVAASPVFAWNPSDRWRLDARYTFSHSSFDQTGTTSNDNSIVLRETWQGWRRVALQATYAYGIESFEDLTADRLGSLGATTIAAGVRFDVPSLTRVMATWEHQWRSNDTTIDRFTIAVVQGFP